MDNLTFYAPIEKADEELRMVYGYASTEALDSQGEIVKKDALAQAIDDYMEWANIREMHQPSAVGKTKSAKIDSKGLYIAAKIVDEEAWQKVKEGVYNGFSIGGRVKTMKGNEITDLSLSEISIVDRPANPECKIDVFKADMQKPTEKNEPTEKKEEVKDVKKSIYTADGIVDLAGELNWIIMCYKDQNKDTSELETAMNALKEAAVKELQEKETYYDFVGSQIEYAEKLVDLEKEAIAEMKKKNAHVEEKTETVEKKEEPVVSEALKLINDKVEKTQMPTDEDIVAYLKASNLPSDPKTIAKVRWELSGKIMEVIGKQINLVQNQDAAPIQKVGKEISAKNKDKITAALKQLNDAVKTLSELGEGLTDDERKVLEEGIKAGSTLTGEQDVEEPAKNKAESEPDKKPLEVAPVEKVESQNDRTLAKVEAELSALKEQVKKMLDTPLPIKARAGYVTVEKFTPSQMEGKQTELAKAEERAKELSEKFQKGTYTLEEKAEAANLGTTIMRLKREVNSFKSG